MSNILVNMQFNADTSNAQSQIQQLQNSLNSIASTKVAVQGGSIDQAVQSAKMLNQHLTAATNVNTGKIDFTALQTSLKTANTDLATLSHNLLAMGPKGQQAFSQVANAIAHADLSTKKANATLQAFGTTLMNTIKWQAASTLIHGVMSTFSAAVTHVESLDRALNNIQIVSNKSAIEMAAFAKRAQEASAALSSTTEEYAKASLIFFQQGLGEQDVLARTEATIKMAKVTGEAVQTVSDQLTAIWNNFDDGSKSLEYYVDVITALGAATASSTSEISDGLQKFAAIAETVGLSYEYAATALATVTAETRQSADVVGTAFKTLFARMEGLKLGDTLDDGTTLNQYSMAMAKAGINIKDANGNLKDMDVILDEMGKKWQTLNKDQQVALAQQVGGIRQYNQLIALMDNWDTFEVNLDIAETSKGTLDKQFEIYQTSVEASAEKLKNAQQSLYEDILSPSTIKSFNTALADALDLVRRLVENAGGLGEVLKFGGLLLLQAVLPKLQTFLLNAANHIKDFIGYSKAARMAEIDRMSKTSHAMAGTQQKTGQDAVNAAFNPRSQQTVLPTVDPNASGAQMRVQMMQEEAGFTAQILDSKKAILALENGMTAKQKEQYQAYNEQIEQQQELVRLAREKQLAATQDAEQSSKTAAKHVAATDVGRQAMGEAADQIRADYSKQKGELDTAYESDMASIDEEHSAAKGDLDARKKKEMGDLEKKRKKAKNKTDKAAVDKEMADAESRYAQEESEMESSFEEKRSARTSQHEQDSGNLVEKRNADLANVAKKADFSGQATQSMTAAVQDAAQTPMAQMATDKMMSQLAEGANGGPAASIENLEKLGSLQAEYNADIEVASGLQAEVGQEIASQASGVKKTAKEQQALNKSSEKVTQFATKYKDELIAAVGESSDLGKEISQLGKDGAKIDLGKLSPENLKKLQGAIGQVEDGLGEASNAAGEMAGAMAEDMAEMTGKDIEIFEGVAEDAQAVKASSLEAETEVDKLHQKASQQLPMQPDIFGAITQGAAQATAAFTGIAMGAQMLSSGINTLYDENATGIEKLMGVMMIMQGVMSTMNGIAAAANVIDTIAVAVKTAKAAATDKETKSTAKGLPGLLTNTVATVANAVAKLFAAEASKGLAGVIAAVLGAALIAGTIALVANTVATQQKTKADEESAKQAEESAASAREAAEAAREEMQAAIELKESYDDLLETYEETGEGKQDLIDKGYEAVNAMGIERGELLLLTGQYHELANAIQAAAVKKAQFAVDASKGATTSSAEAFIAKENVEGTGGTWTTSVNGQKVLALSLGGGTGDETALNGWLAMNGDNTPWRIEGGMLVANYTNGEDLPYVLKKLKELREGVAAYAATHDIDTEGQEFFTEIAEMDESGAWDLLENTVGAYDSSVQTNIEAAKTSELSDVDSQADYNRLYQQFVNQALRNAGIDPTAEGALDTPEAKEIIAAVEEYMAKDDEFKNYEMNRVALEQLGKSGSGAAKEYAIDRDQNGYTALDKWAAENGYADENGFATDEAIDLFFKINPQYMGDFGEIETALDRAQGILDGQQLIVQYDFMSGAMSALKESMSSADWQKFLSDYAELFDVNSDKYIGMSFEDFANKSFEEQQGILINATSNPTVGYQQQIDAQQEQVDFAKSDAGRAAFEEGEMARVEAFFTAEALAYFNENAPDLKFNSAAELFNQYYMPDGEEHWNNQDMSDYNNFTQEQKDTADIEAQRAGFENFEDFVTKRQEYNSAHSEEGMNAAYEKYVDDEETKLQGYKDEAVISGLEYTNKQIELYDLDAGEVTEYTDAIVAMAEAADENDGIADTLAEDKAAAREAGKEMARYAKACEDVAENYGDWMDALNSKDIVNSAKAVKELDSAYSNMLDIDMGSLSDQFLRNTDYLELMQQAADGNVDAYNRLQLAAAQDIYAQKIGELSDETIAAMERVAAVDNIDVGEKIYVGEDTIADDLWAIYEDAYMTAIEGGKSVAEAKAIANSLMQAEGFNVGEMEWEEKEVTVTGQLPTGYKPIQGVKYEDSTGMIHTGANWEPEPGETYTYTTTMLVPKKSGNNSFTKSAETVGGSKKNSGGGGGEKKKADEVKKSDVVDRYKEVTDSLDNNADAMEKASRAAERLYGRDRLANMQKANDLLKNEIALTKQKREEAEKYLTEDFDALTQAATEAGITFTTNDAGDITNYTEEMSKLYEELDAEIQAANKDGNATEDEQKKIDDIQEKIDNVKDALATYEDTRELIEDLDTELQEKFDEWQDNNFEILNTELELKIEINDMDLQRLEYYLGKVEDDFYQMAEAAAFMVLNYNQDGLGGQLTSYTSLLAHQQDYLTKLEEQHVNKEISDEAYIQGLKDASSAIYDNLNNLRELDTAMMSYYSDTLSAAGEELAKYTDLMENSSGVLEHYVTIAEMLGKSTDYKYMKNILTAQATVAQNAYNVSKKNFEMLQRQAQEREQAYRDAEASGLASDAELEMLKQQWWDARTAVGEAQDTMLSDAETWGEALKAIFENELADAGKELEKTLSGAFGSFEAMNNAFERKNSLQEEYLTTTNKIYETNKLMRTAQQEIDKTTNEAAKRRLKQFINETGALQDQTKLSQYELDIQQAKYDLLLAEIALEEAQRAKTTVRLQRDNEGNFSYVYTADENQIAGAQQKLEDAQNALYNKGLEGANKYAQQYQEIMQEMSDTITEIEQKRYENAYASELEYQQALSEAKEYYYEKLTQYSHLYQISLTTDTRVAADAWTTEYASMVNSTEDWMSAVNDYVSKVSTAFTSWSSAMSVINGDTFANIDQSLSDIVADSNELATTVTDTVIPALEGELTAVTNVTDAYATFRQTIKDITVEYENMAKAAENAIKAANGLESGTDSGGPSVNVGDLSWDRVVAAYTAITAGDWGDRSNQITNGVAAGYTEAEVKKAQELLQKIALDGLSLEGAKTALGFASGGYTGDWSGSYGKLAFLHKKELILTEHDTENFLTSMEVLEHILQMIDLQSAHAQLSGLLAIPKTHYDNNNVLEQNVHIEANFPGVQDHNEIELAINNLINTASQYANRK